MAESADATDLKSVDGDIVWVRPPLALLKRPGETGLFYAENRFFPDKIFPELMKSVKETLIYSE